MVKQAGKLGRAAVTLVLLGAPVSGAAQEAPKPPEPPAATPPAATPTATAGATPLPPTTPKPAPKPATAWKPPAPKPPPPPPPPDTPARLWIIAPGPKEPWTMRIDNEGTRAIRIPADIRLLSFEVEVPSNDPKQPKKKPTVYKCAVPDALRPSKFPEYRALLLAPGHSYIESFDPRLFCFGKNAAALVGSAVVRTKFGWDPPPKWSLAAKKPPAPPFAAEGTDKPAVTTPLRQLTAPTLMLSYGTPAAPSTAPAAPGSPAASTTPAGLPATTPVSATSASEPATAPAGPALLPAAAGTTTTPATPILPGAAPATPAASATAATPATPATPILPGPPIQPGTPAAPAAAPAPIVDANAPRLAVFTPAYADASAPRTASVTVDVKNAGGRSMIAALRPRMVAFEVIGPDRTVACPSSPPTQAIPRDMYREYKPDGKTSFTLLLQEVCPDNVFSRPGLYKVNASFWANEPGSELGLDAFTGRGAATEPTLLRLHTAREPFYRDPPKAVPTPKPEMPEDDGEATP